LPLEDAELPKIPAHCISYGDAKYILSGLRGESAANIFSNFSTGLDIQINVGVDSTGFGYTESHFVTLEVNNVYESREINNVIAVITGCVEPDRYVMVGNHRDSWTFGAVDPSSGTASMLGLSKAIANVMREYNWCPRRSIVFCSWGAEEYGLVGSTEFVEQNQKLLSSQVVAYLNVDSSVTGNSTLISRSSPLLYDVLWQASSYVPNPDPEEINNNRKTVYDTYKYRYPSSFNGSSVSYIEPPGGGSDHLPFLQIPGVPVMDFYYTCAPGDVMNPNYHTMYETYYLQSQIVDKGFNVRIRYFY
jgi:N-acetylated-alpha-linked acidic dipeptidase